MGFDEWIEMVEGLDLLDGGGFSRREAHLCFVWSRMWTVDDGKLASRVKMVNLWFEDFLECLVRASLFRSQPTDNEIVESGFTDAGEYILHLKATSEYDDFCLAHPPLNWQDLEAHMKNDDSSDSSTLTQPPEKLVEHLITLVIRTIEVAVTSGDTADNRLNRIEIDKFRHLRKS